MKISVITLASLALGSALIAGSSAAQASPSCVEGPIPSFLNGSFETPRFALNTFGWLGPSTVTGWQTTDSSQVIELWSNGYLGFTASDGQQLLTVEANDSVTHLYQDFATTPGQTLNWSFDHSARYSSNSSRVTMSLGAPSSLTSQKVSTATYQVWTHQNDAYVVPAGQTVTRLEFLSDSATGSTYGDNLIDNVVVTTQLCATPAAPSTDPTLASTGSQQNLLPAGIALIASGLLAVILRRKPAGTN